MKQKIHTNVNNMNKGDRTEKKKKEEILCFILNEEYELLDSKVFGNFE